MTVSGPTSGQCSLSSLEIASTHSWPDMERPAQLSLGNWLALGLTQALSLPSSILKALQCVRLVPKDLLWVDVFQGRG